MGILNLDKPDYAGQIYLLGQRVQAVEVTVSGVAVAQATYNARLTALENGSTGGGGGSTAAWKWGDRALLPAGHPYKNSPPMVNV